MKTLLSTIFTILFLVSCQDTANVTDSLVNPKDNSISKDPELHYNIILPPKAPEWQDSIFTVSKEINGNLGGFIYLNKYYIAANGDSVVINARLLIPTFAFQGTETITIRVDDKYASLHFTPSMAFAKNLKLYNSFSAIDLNGFEKKSLDFVYVTDDGSIELLKKKSIQIFPKWGLIQVNSVELPHFSRFGWVRMHVSGN